MGKSATWLSFNWWCYKINSNEAPKNIVIHLFWKNAAGYLQVYAAHHVVTHPFTNTHTVPAGVFTHTVAGHPVVGGVLPAFAARTVAIAAPAAEEAVVDA